MNISEHKMDTASIVFIVFIVIGLVAMVISLFKTIGNF